MEHDAIVKLALHQCLDLLDVLGGEIRPQANDDIAVLGPHHDRVGDGVVGRSGESDEQGKREQRSAAEGMHSGLLENAHFASGAKRIVSILSG